jgi:hypothetical protein
VSAHLLRVMLPHHTRQLQPNMLQRQQHRSRSSATEQSCIWRRRLHSMLQDLQKAV